MSFFVEDSLQSVCDNAIINEPNSLLKIELPYILSIAIILLIAVTVHEASQEARKFLIRELRLVSAY